MDSIFLYGVICDQAKLDQSKIALLIDTVLMLNQIN